MIKTLNASDDKARAYGLELAANFKQLKINLLLIFFFIFSSHISAQDNILFDHIDKNDGLTGNSILTIEQDHQGFMWFGSRYGLNRYDGYTVTNYYSNNNDSTTICHNYINKIYENRKNELWIATGSGVSLFNRDSNNFSPLTILNDSLDISKSYFTDIIEDQYGNFWTLNLNSLIQLITPGNDKSQKLIKATFSFNNNQPNCLFIDSKGVLWIGTKNGLYYFEDQKIKYYNLRINGEKTEKIGVNEIYQLSDNKLAIASEYLGLILLEPHNGYTTNYQYQDNKSSIINNRVRTVFQSEQGDIWIGTRHGLSIINRNGKKVTSHIHKSIDSKSISDNSVRIIYGDKTGGIWLGTYAGGVNYYHKQNTEFTLIKRDYTNPNTLSSDKVSCLLKDRDNILWIGTEGRGLNRINETTGKISSFSNYRGYYEAIDNIKSIAQEDDRFLWLGTNGGLSRFDKKTQSFKNYFHDPANSNSITENRIHSIIYDSGCLWIGTYGGGLNKFEIEKDKFHSFKQNKTLHKKVHNNINCLLQEEQIGIWIGSDEGIDFFSFQDQNMDRSSDFEKLKKRVGSQKVITLFSDDHNFLWVGTEGNGLFCVNKKNHQIKFIRHWDDIVGSIIYSIEQDDYSNIWISTNLGLAKLTTSYTDNTLKIEKANNYKKKHGLEKNIYSYRSSLKDNSGKLYFGGIHGYNTFFPKKISQDFPTTPIVFTKLKINSQKEKHETNDNNIKKDISQVSEITLQYYEQPFTIGYAGLNYINPKDTYYSYRLVGLDNQWIKQGQQRTITYAHLREGRYQLQVKASGNNSDWQQEYKSLYITIKPPFYRSWTAYLTYLILVLLIIWGGIIYTNKWFNLKNRLAFEKLSKEKEQELQENKTRFFTDVSHELRTPLTLIITPLEKLMSESSNRLRFDKEFKTIWRNSQKMLSLIDQLLDLRKFEKGHHHLDISEGNIIRFLEETTLPFRELALFKGYEFKFVSSHTEINMNYDPRKMEIVISNLLSNAFKAITSQGKIEVRVSETIMTSEEGEKTEMVKIEIEDNGKGIPEKDLQNIFNRFYQIKDNSQNKNSSGIGLELTMRMINLHGGEISVKSQPASNSKQGKTIFTVLLPKKEYGSTSHKNSIKEEKHNYDSLYPTEFLKGETYQLSLQEETMVLDEMLNHDSSKPILLIVEDNLEVLKFIADMFQNHYNVK